MLLYARPLLFDNAEVNGIPYSAVIIDHMAAQDTLLLCAYSSNCVP